MTVRFEKIIPLPMLEQDTSGSEIWEADSLSFEQGKSYLIEAASGRGKTSLLSIIFGLRKDYRGKAFIDDNDINSLTGKQWSGLRKYELAFIFQGLELFNDMTALENIRLKNAITRHKTTQEIREMADRVGIAPFLNRKAGILSFGQQQRVAIIRALCQPFSFMLADECFSHIDQENSLKAFALIREECMKQGAGLIMTSLNGTSNLQFDYR
ncbi:MAG TPA: ATP-binding cassette domain-containing protein, partial [Bacteroidaceae bacterium]|nr:ATP-binding cassette domain-containing protein [Bacteroidaceae bacterium]